MSEVYSLSSEDREHACGCKYFGDTAQLVCCEQRIGCKRCRRGGFDGVILADTEEWRIPLCVDCFYEVGQDPDWDKKS